ncbi:MAG: hypothetical protein QXT26_08945 [Thermoproteota archaeon]
MVKIEFTVTWEHNPNGLKHEVYGCYHKKTKTVYVFIDRLVEDLNDALDYPQFEDFVSQAINYVLLHELIHHLKPEASESQTEWATDMLTNTIE